MSNRPLSPPVSNYKMTSATAASSDNPEPREPLFRLEERLLREEHNVAEALVRRTKLLAEIAQRKRSGGPRKTPGPPPNQALEKALWSVWEAVLPEGESGRFRLWRQLVAQCNSLGYALGEPKTSRGNKPWLLNPTAPHAAVTLIGPSDALRAKTVIFWSATAGTFASVHPVLLNDGVIELIRALNQAGAGLAWERDTVTHTPGSAPGQDETRKTIHVGQCPFNLALMLAAALARPGVATFSGSGTLNMLSLKPWQQFLPQLGARLQQLNPHAPGLPVRLESSGRPEHVRIDDTVPKELIWAMLACAPFYPQGLRLTWDTPGILANFRLDLEAFTQLYDLFGVPYSVQETTVSVSPALPRLAQTLPPGNSSPPGSVHIPLDRTLSAMLLTWSRLTGRAMRLEGHWPDLEGRADPFLDLLRSCGMNLKIQPDHIRAEPGPWPDQPVLDVRGLPRAVPLAATMALASPGVSILTDLPEKFDTGFIQNLAHWSGRTCRQESSTLVFQPAPRGLRRSALDFEAPDALWAMAAAMLAFKHPGVHLVNPGEVAGLWPGFWHLYNHVLSVSKRRPEGVDHSNPIRASGHFAPSDPGPQGESTTHADRRHASPRRRIKL